MTLRKETLTTKSDIKALFQSGKRVAAKEVVVFYKKNTQDCIRILYCSDRSCKNAVQRNRVKRVLRALVRELDLSRLSAVDLALKASYKFSFLDYSFRLQQLDNLIRKIKNE